MSLRTLHRPWNSTHYVCQSCRHKLQRARYQTYVSTSSNDDGDWAASFNNLSGDFTQPRQSDATSVRKNSWKDFRKFDPELASNVFREQDGAKKQTRRQRMAGQSDVGRLKSRLSDALNPSAASRTVDVADESEFVDSHVPTATSRRLSRPRSLRAARAQKPLQTSDAADMVDKTTDTVDVDEGFDQYAPMVKELSQTTDTVDTDQRTTDTVDTDDAFGQYTPLVKEAPPLQRFGSGRIETTGDTSSQSNKSFEAIIAEINQEFERKLPEWIQEAISKQPPLPPRQSKPKRLSDSTTLLTAAPSNTSTVAAPPAAPLPLTNSSEDTWSVPSFSHDLATVPFSSDADGTSPFLDSLQPELASSPAELAEVSRPRPLTGSRILEAIRKGHQQAAVAASQYTNATPDGEEQGMNDDVTESPISRPAQMRKREIAVETTSKQATGGRRTAKTHRAHRTRRVKSQLNIKFCMSEGTSTVLRLRTGDKDPEKLTGMAPSSMGREASATDHSERTNGHESVSGMSSKETVAARPASSLEDRKTSAGQKSEAMPLIRSCMSSSNSSTKSLAAPTASQAHLSKENPPGGSPHPNNNESEWLKYNDLTEATQSWIDDVHESPTPSQPSLSGSRSVIQRPAQPLRSWVNRVAAQNAWNASRKFSSSARVYSATEQPKEHVEHVAGTAIERFEATRLAWKRKRHVASNAAAQVVDKDQKDGGLTKATKVDKKDEEDGGSKKAANDAEKQTKDRNSKEAAKSIEYDTDHKIEDEVERVVRRYKSGPMTPIRKFSSKLSMTPLRTMLSLKRAQKATLHARAKKSAESVPKSENMGASTKRDRKKGDAAGAVIRKPSTKTDAADQGSEHKALWEVMTLAEAMKGRAITAPTNVSASEVEEKNDKRKQPQLDVSTSTPAAAVSVEPSSLEIAPLNIPQPTVPGLEYGLDRVLFNSGVYQLQDPHSRVFNFDPYLQKIMPVQDFDFNALKEYKTSSQDETLNALAKDYGKKYIGSTSSMTSTLGHFHYLLSDWRPLNLKMMSRGFPDKLDQFTRINRAPNAMFLRWKQGTYAVDADKEYDGANVLMMLGKSMEKLLTMPTDEYERYRKSDPRSVSEEERTAPESFEYTTMGDFLMRSQLDAYDSRLPGTGTFDLKTRSVLSVRMDAEDFKPMSGYEIYTLQGRFESYEREYYDMIRSTMLKYSLQVRMGRMDGIFVAYHNVERIFGFQYIPVQEMDRAIHGQSDRCLGDQEFRTSIKMLNDVFDKATAQFPETSLRFHFETGSEAMGEGGPTTIMWIFAEPMEEAEIDRIQSTAKEKVAEFERNVMGIAKNEDEGSAEDVATTEDVEVAAATPEVESAASETSEAEPVLENNETSTQKSTEYTSTTSSADPKFMHTIATTPAEDRRPLWAASIIVKSRVNGADTPRPESLKPGDTWELDYLLTEWSNSDAIWARYEQTKDARKKMFMEFRSDEDEAAAMDDEHKEIMEKKKKKEQQYISFLRELSEKGRKFRGKMDKLEEGKVPVVLGRD